MKAATVFETIRENITGYNVNTEMHNEGPVQGITSMYQNLGEDHIFILKASKNSAKYLQDAILRKPALIITDFEKDAFIDFHEEVVICYIDDFAEVSIRLVELFYGEHIGRMKYIAVIRAADVITPPIHRFELFTERNYEFILDFAHTPVAIKESIINAMKYAEKMEKKLIVMVTGIGMRGYRKIRMTMKLVPEALHHLVLAAEQIGYEDEEKIVGMMQKHLPASYDDSNTTTALSRQEGIIRAIGHAGPDTIILLTGINEPQHYRGDVIAHDDRQFILQYLEDWGKRKRTLPIGSVLFTMIVWIKYPSTTNRLKEYR